jgi:hypothetical protein
MDRGDRKSNVTLELSSGRDVQGLRLAAEQKTEGSRHRDRSSDLPHSRSSDEWTEKKLTASCRVKVTFHS